MQQEVLECELCTGVIKNPEYRKRYLDDIRVCEDCYNSHY